MILIINEGGIPIYSKMLGSREEDMSSILISSFLTAIQSFSSEVVSNNNSQIMKIELGGQYLSLYKQNNFSVASIMNDSNEEYGRMIMKIAQIFESDLVEIIDVNQDFGGLNDLIDSLVVQMLAEIKVKSDLIPIVLRPLPPNQSELSLFIDGNRTVNEIINISGVSKSDILVFLFNLFQNGYISFQQKLGRKTTVIKSPTSSKRIITGSSYCNSRTDEDGNLISPCNKYGEEGCTKIIKELQGPMFLENLGFFDVVEKKEYVHCLLQNQIFITLNPLQISILSAKKFVNALLDSVSSILNVSTVDTMVSTAIKILEEVGLSEEFQSTVVGPRVNLDMNKYLDYNAYELKTISDTWFGLLTEILYMIPKNRKKIIHSMMEKNEDMVMEIMEFDQDFNSQKLQDFLFLIETMA